MNTSKLTPKQTFFKDLVKELSITRDKERFNQTGEILEVNASNFKDINALFIDFEETCADNLYMSNFKY